MSNLTFDDLGLHEKVLEAVKLARFTEPTEIQQRAIPAVLTGGDVMASSQTGTGKTAAFVLPALTRLLNTAPKHGRGPRVLVLTPTRELAAQINENVALFGKFCKIKTGSVVGGLSYGPQIKLFKNPLDILVATPGRLMDHMDEGRVDFSRLEMVILDEADRMLDMGFVPAVRKIVSATPRERQTLLFSATLEGRVDKISQEFLNTPERIQLAVNTDKHELITQEAYRVNGPDQKRRILAHHLADNAVAQALIFTRTKRGADRLAKTLSKDGHSCAALHGDMSQNARRRVVERMRSFDLRLVVATDVAARGLDITSVTHVINFDMPMVAEDYIHRIGRTGRAGVTGTAYSFISPDESSQLRDIEKLIGRKLEKGSIPGMQMGSDSAPRSKNSDSRRTPRNFGGPGKSGAPKSWKSRKSGKQSFRSRDAR